MRIQILHGRDPDSACEFSIYLDGKKVTSTSHPDVEVTIEDIDPGRGYRREQWDERIAEAEAAADADPDNEFLAETVGWLVESDDSVHIR